MRQTEYPLFIIFDSLRSRNLLYKKCYGANHSTWGDYIVISCSVFHFHEDGLIFRFHNLRHTFASNLLSNGAAPKDVQKRWGTRMSVPRWTFTPTQRGKRNATPPDCWIRWSTGSKKLSLVSARKGKNKGKYIQFEDLASGNAWYYKVF